MSLRQKTLITVGVTLIGLMIVLYASSRVILLSSFARLEEQQTRQSTQRALDALFDDIAQLNEIAGEWASRDDTYAFMEDANPDKLNLTNDIFANLRLDWVVLVDSSDRIVLGKAFDHQNKVEMPVPQGLQEYLGDARFKAVLLRHANPQSSISGVTLLSGSEPVLVASRPILKSGGQGPIRGTLIVGRTLDNAEIEQLARLTHPSSLAVQRFDSTQSHLFEQSPLAVQPLSDQTIAGYALVRDIQGNPALVLTTETLRDTFIQGQATLSYLIMWLVIASLVFIGITIVIWDQLALSRLARLNAGVSHIGASGDLSARVDAAGGDELSNVAGAINRMLAALQQSAKALRESEERFRRLAENAPDVITRFEMLPQPRFTYVSPAITPLSGLTPEDYYADPDLGSKVTHPDDRPLLDSLARGEMPPGAPVTLRWVRQDGAVIWVELRNVPIHDEAGNLVAVEGIARNVTERRQAEEALRESEQRFRSIAETASDAIIIFDQNESILFWNSAAKATFGYQGGETVGKLLESIMSKHFCRVLREEMKRVASTGTSNLIGKTMEMVGVRKNGSEFPVELSLASWSTKREFFFTIISRDVTGRKQAEEALRKSEELFRRRAAELRALYETSLRLSAQLETAQLLRLMVEQAIELLGAEAGGLYIYDPQHNQLVLSLAVSYFQEIMPAKLNPGQGVAGQALQNRRAMMVDDYRAGPGRLDIRMTEPRAALAVPLLGTLGVLGVLVITSERRYDEHDVRLTELFAAQAAVALENARLHAEVERRALELAALNKAAQAMSSILDLPTVLDVMMAVTRHLLDAGGVSVLLQDPDTHELVFAAVDSPGAKSLAGKRMPSTEGIAGWVVQKKQTVLVPDAYSDPRFYRQIDEITGLTTRSLVAAPLMVKATVIGVIEATNKAYGVFDQHDVEMLEAMAGSAAIATENARLYQMEKDQRELAETLREVGATLASTLNTDAVLDRLLEQVSRVVPNDAADIMLIEGELARVARWRGYERHDSAQSITDVTFPIDDVPNLRQMAETGEPLVIPDTHADLNWIIYPGVNWLRSYAGAPICVRDKTVGFLSAHSTTPSYFGPRHAQRLRAFANQAAIALENARLFEEERRTADRLQALSRRLVEVQETERSRIARELHDEASQALTSMMVNLRLLEQEARKPRAVVAHVAELKRMTGSVLENLHRLAADLRPASLDHLGLVVALRQHIQTFGRQHDLTVQFEAAGLDDERMPMEVETALYRIVQEALTNVARHAHASRADVILERRGDHLIVIVEDNGLGFVPDAAWQSDRLGLVGMRERAEMLGGTLVVESEIGAGTTLLVEVPYAHPHSGR